MIAVIREFTQAMPVIPINTPGYGKSVPVKELYMAVMPCSETTAACHVIIHDIYMDFRNSTSAHHLKAIWRNEPIKDLKYAFNDPNSETRVHSVQEVVAYLRFLKANGVEPSQIK
jgi:hypothetical protein